MKKLGLIGFPLGHSFSKKYYLEKFERENISGIDYDLYPIERINDFIDLYRDKDMYGVNVTKPYKISVLPYLDELADEAKAINAVNCIQIRHLVDGSVFLKGFNTDVYGFQKSLEPLLRPHHKNALILGTGGAAQAVIYALETLGITYRCVSRHKGGENLSYDELFDGTLDKYKLIINCTPAGTYPNIDEAPDIPYADLSEEHLLYDLVYNPEQTLFLKKGKERGASIKNGLEMLHIQAEKNWEIWNS